MSQFLTRRHFLAHSTLAALALATGCSSRSHTSRLSTTPTSELAQALAAAKQVGFYIPEDPNYTIFASAADSLRFTLTRCMTTYKGHACSTSSFVDPEGKIMDWHDFGPLEGPGWASNAVGGAYELIKWSRFVHEPAMEKTAISVLDHVLNNGFIDRDTGLIRGYRHIPRDQIVLNFKHNNDWFCPGSNAKIAVQLLLCADWVPQRREALQSAAKAYAKWLDSHLQPLPNGWFPRRCTPTGAHYTKAAEGGNDRFFASSADGLFIIQLWAELAARNLADYRPNISRALRAFTAANGFYASINHDTYDPHENVAYSVAFRVFRRCSQVLKDPALSRYALDQILPNLDRFKMREDRNGVATKGLLWMEDSWDTSYLWENAEASLAHLEAYTDTGKLAYLNDALVILRAAARHHHGPYGFLTEGVDWNNHVGQQHHIDNQQFAAIKYTEPFLNNQHIVEPTLYFLENHALRSRESDGQVYRDHENNILAHIPA
ncbi:MAG: twin-arginine translocation signal domain-containing protein [Bacillota bacterium]